MKIIIFFFAFINVYSQNNSKISFEEFEKKLNENNIKIEQVDTINETLSKIDSQVLEFLYNKNEKFDGKIITFMGGSVGTTISRKTTFLKGIKSNYKHKKLSVFSIIKLTEKEKELSGSDYLVFSWTKMIPARTKRLLLKIKNHNL